VGGNFFSTLGFLLSISSNRIHIGILGYLNSILPFVKNEFTTPMGAFGETVSVVTGAYDNFGVAVVKTDVPNLAFISKQVVRSEPIGDSPFGIVHNVEISGVGPKGQELSILKSSRATGYFEITVVDSEAGPVLSTDPNRFSQDHVFAFCSPFKTNPF
jgi:hypothetical protein